MRVLVLGGSGLVGAQFVELQAGQFEIVAPSHTDLDVLDSTVLATALERSKPDAVVNFVGWADVDGAEAERDHENGRVFALNALFPAQLARQCLDNGVHLVHVSTDYVFDGTNAERPYSETDTPNPLSWYARTKYVGECRVLEAHQAACIARIEMPFTATHARKSDFARLVARRLAGNEPVIAVDDQRITPILLDDAAAALAELVRQRFEGIVHLAATTWTTPYDYAMAIARRLGLREELISRQPFADFAKTRAAARPQHSWLDVSLFTQRCCSAVLRNMDAQVDAWAAAGVRFEA
ncbi:MAG: NAD(P)-dependent oxidoreductase [Chloroflexi bacterium]|nr:NAD(P)-dependent oxidoreductase [Chloroflexota bacterium]